MDKEMELIKGFADLTSVVSCLQISIRDLTECVKLLMDRVEKLEKNLNE